MAHVPPCRELTFLYLGLWTFTVCPSRDDGSQFTLHVAPTPKGSEEYGQATPSTGSEANIHKALAGLEQGWLCFSWLQLALERSGTFARTSTSPPISRTSGAAADIVILLRGALSIYVMYERRIRVSVVRFAFCTRERGGTPSVERLESGIRQLEPFPGMPQVTTY